jgi:hypothetical protein
MDAPPDPRRIIIGVMLVLLLGAMNQTIVAVACRASPSASTASR